MHLAAGQLLDEAVSIRWADAAASLRAVDGRNFAKRAAYPLMVPGIVNGYGGIPTRWPLQRRVFAMSKRLKLVDSAEAEIGSGCG